MCIKLRHFNRATLKNRPTGSMPLISTMAMAMGSSPVRTVITTASMMSAETEAFIGEIFSDVP